MFASPCIAQIINSHTINPYDKDINNDLHTLIRTMYPSNMMYNKDVDLLNLFVASCVEGSQAIAKWLFVIGINDPEDKLMTLCGYNGNKYEWMLRRINGSDKMIKTINPFTEKIGQNAYILLSEICRNGHFEIAKWFYEKMIDDMISLNLFVADIRRNDGGAFVSSCAGGHIEIAKWLYSLGVNINSIRAFKFKWNKVDHRYVSLNFGPFNDNTAFLNSCIHGHLNIAKWLYSIGVDLKSYSKVLRYSCDNGQFEIVKWLRTIENNEYERDDYTYAFDSCCGYGHLEIAKWIYEEENDLISNYINTGRSYSFLLSCRENHIEIAKWLYSIGGSVFIDPDCKTLLYECCNIADFEIVKFLHTLGVDIHADNNKAFKISCFRNHYDIAKWLLDMGINYRHDTESNLAWSYINGLKYINENKNNGSLKSVLFGKIISHTNHSSHVTKTHIEYIAKKYDQISYCLNLIKRIITFDGLLD